MIAIDIWELTTLLLFALVVGIILGSYLLRPKVSLN